MLRRPLYRDYFDWIDEIGGPDDISILANADIVIDPHFAIFRIWTLPAMTAFALARWDTLPDGSRSVRNRNDSQDAWVFRGHVGNVNGDFRIGVPRCDNRVAKELEIAGYSVRNPSLSLRTYHIHSGHRDPYPGELQPGFVSPPYLYIWPHNLWSLRKTAIHNVRYPYMRVGWRVDSRKWKARLKVHSIRKAFAALTGGDGAEAKS